MRVHKDEQRVVDQGQLRQRLKRIKESSLLFRVIDVSGSIIRGCVIFIMRPMLSASTRTFAPALHNFENSCPR